jgi:hypothetical protein
MASPDGPLCMQALLFNMPNSSCEEPCCIDLAGSLACTPSAQCCARCKDDIISVWVGHLFEPKLERHEPLHGCSMYVLTNTQEVTTQSAAPSKCIHSSDQKFDTDRTSTGKQNITSKHHTTLLHTFICRHPHASPEAGTTAPSQQMHDKQRNSPYCMYVCIIIVIIMVIHTTTIS